MFGPGLTLSSTNTFLWESLPICRVDNTRVCYVRQNGLPPMDIVVLWRPLTLEENIALQSPVAVLPMYQYATWKFPDLGRLPS